MPLPNTFPTALLLCLACVGGAAHAQKVMTPGGWELTATITRELPGQQPEAMGTHTTRLCLGPDFLAREPYLDPKLDESKVTARGATCSTSDYERQGDTATWRMACELNDGSTLKARIRNAAGPQTLSLRMEQDVERPGGGKGRAIMASTGRHVGACTGDMPKP